MTEINMIVPTKDELAICANCKYWNNRNNSTKNLCILSMSGSDKMGSGSGLRTSYDFGCNQFKKKQ